MSYLLVNGEIVLAGDVGDFGDGLPFFTAADAHAALAKVGKNTRATVRLNSGGGSATEGTAIAAVFSAHQGKVDVVVEGVAASAASAAACGADTVTMSLGAVFMLHEGSALTIGTAEDHEAAISALDAINVGMAEVYARKSGIPPETILAMMAAETWLTADEAVDAGFADGIVGEAEPRKPARFDYSARYRHPPAALLARQLKPRPPAPPVIRDDEPLDPAEIAELCTAAEQPEAAADLIRARATLPQARARLDNVGDMRALLALNRGPVPPSLKADMLSGRMTLPQAREALFDAMATASEAEEAQVDHHPRTGTGTLDGRAMARRSMQKIVAEKYGSKTKDITR